MKIFYICAALTMFFLLGNKTYAANIANGRAVVERTNCVSCHGTGLNKPISGAYPKLAGQFADYTYAALRAYQAKSSNPLVGRDNPIMHAQIQDMSQSDMRDVAAYIESLPGSLVQKR